MSKTKLECNFGFSISGNLLNLSHVHAIIARNSLRFAFSILAIYATDGIFVNVSKTKCMAINNNNQPHHIVRITYM